jgi:hypothetical protein
MKQHILLIICIIFSLNKTYTQEFNGGLIAGLSTSQVSGDMLGGFNKLGFLIGGFTKRKINNKLNLQFEITYIKKGSRNPNINKDNIQEISLSYIEIPFGISIKQKNNIDIETGILSGVIINSKVNDYYGLRDIENDFKKYDFGIFAGINYYLKDNIILNTRISNSVLPIRPHASNATWGLNKGQYNTVLSISIYYNIT